MNKSDSIKHLAIAMNKAQAEMGGASKDSANPFFKSSYADLPSVLEACKASLNNHGISIVQSTDVLVNDGKLVPMDVKKGDIILLPKYGGTEVKIDDKEYKIVSEEDIVAIIE